MKRCPECGAMSFLVSAHVVQDWVVDENEDFISCADECSMVTHFPDDDDIWECNDCGFSAPGYEFNVTITHEMIRCKHCSYLVENDDGRWVCDDCGKEIHTIPDDECSAEQEW